MKLTKAQEALMALPGNGDLNPADLPKTWNGAADLDEKIYRAQLAREANPTRRSTPQQSGMTTDDWETLGKAMATLIKPRIEALEARCTALEQGLAKHAGPFRAGKAYAGGEFCTRQGSLWICKSDSPTGLPGESADWRLVVKSGAVKK